MLDADNEFVKEAREWVHDCLSGKSGYPEELMDRVLNKARTSMYILHLLTPEHTDQDPGVASFLETTKTIRSQQSTTTYKTQWPEPVRLPTGEGRPSAPLLGSAQATSQTTSVGDAQNKVPNVETNTLPPSTAGLPQSPIAQTHGSPGAPTLPRTLPRVSPAVSPNPDSASDQSLPVSSNSSSQSSGTSQTGASSSKVLSDTPSDSTVASSKRTSVPSTNSGQDSDSTPLSSSTPSSVPGKNTTNPIALEAGNGESTPHTQAGFTTPTQAENDESQPNGAATDSKEDEKTKWRRSAQEELDRRFETPKILTRVMAGECISWVSSSSKGSQSCDTPAHVIPSDEELCTPEANDMRSETLAQYRQHLLAMFPHAWHTDTSQITSLYA